MNVGPSISEVFERIRLPPNQRMIATAVVPRNSLMGWASAVRRLTLLLMR